MVLRGVCRGRPVLLAAALALVACKEGLPPGLADDSVPLTPSDGQAEQSAPQTVGEPPPSALVAMTALSRAFVSTFAPYADEARRLRTTDPRYTVQRNDWVGRGGRVHASYPLASARFDYAHAAGLSGAGQTVAVVDSGFMTTHEVFDGVSLEFPLSGTAVEEHGTAVASIIAGSSGVMTGVSPGAGLMLSSFDSMERLATATRAAQEAGAVAQNNSWGFLADAGPAEFGAILAGTSYLEALIDYASEGVVVFAAPNAPDRTRATLMEALPVFVPEVEAGWLAVVNAVPVHDGARVLSADLVSAGCLEAARWCLAADGAWIAAGASASDAYVFATGTSFAAPQVSGALAILAEAFPDLTPHELRARLLASADNGFFPHDGQLEIAPGFFHGYSRTFGHGFLDLRAALLPIGTPEVPLPAGGAVPLDRPVLRAGPALGDRLAEQVASRGIVATDALGAGFRIGAGALVARTLPPPLVADRLARIASADRAGPAAGMGVRTGAEAMALMPGRHFELGSPETGLSVDIAMPGSGGGDVGIALRRTAPGSGVTLGVGLMHDGSGALGISGAEGGRALWAATLDVEARMELGTGAALALFGQIGVQQGAGVLAFADVAPSVFTGFGADLSLGAPPGHRGDRVSIGVTVPTAVSRGSARMTLPVALRDGSAVFERMTVGLAPDAREVRLSAGLGRDIGNGWRLSADIVHAINRGHVAGQTETGAVFGVSARF